MDKSTPSIVHESEAQRRHSRVKLPSRLRLDIDNVVYFFTIKDISASGFCIYDDQGVMQDQNVFNGHLHFVVQSLEMHLPIAFQIVSRNDSDGRLGCEFHDLGKDEASVLRILISKFISGEMLATDDLISTLHRDNYTKARLDQTRPLTKRSRIRAIIGTGFIFVVGIVAFMLILNNIYARFFVTHAQTAVVSIPANWTVAPRDGYVQYLVAVGDTVSPGQPLLTLESPLMDMLDGVADTAGLPAAQLRDNFADRVGGVVNAECNCQIVELMSTDGQYVVKGQRLARLASAGQEGQILARFDFRDLSRIAVGTTVSVDLIDGSEPLSGQITKLHLADDMYTFERVETDILATITTSSPIPVARVNQPVNVTVGRLNMPF